MITSVCLIFLFFIQVPAQPTGKCGLRTRYSEDCRGELAATINYLVTQLNILNERISREPKNADLYYQRGRFFTHIIYEIQLGLKNVEFDGKIYFSDIDTKAIADFTTAINLLPKPEYYENRGKIYASYWEREIDLYLYLRNANEKKTKEQIMKDVGQLFVENENFKAAEKDFQKAVGLSADYEASKVSREKLSRLYARRGGELWGNEYIAKIIGGEKASDVALADYDRVIDYYKTLAANDKPAWVKDAFDYQINLRGNNQSIYDNLMAKGEAAVRFGRDVVALESFNQAEKYQYNQSSDCRVYANRAEIFLKSKDFESALREVSTALKSENLNCRGIVRLRGDVYLRVGEWKRAAKDYTVFLTADFGKGDKETLLKRGKIYLKLGEFKKAAADFSSLIDSDSLCEKNYQLRAQAYRSAGNLQAAQIDEEEVQNTLKRQKNYQPSNYCYYHQQ